MNTDPPQEKLVSNRPSTEDPRAQYRVTWIGIIVNVLLAGAKIFIGYFAYSRALVADGVHSFSDLISDALVLFSLRIGNKPSDTDHPYGHGRFESISALGVAVILGVVAGGILLDGLRSIFQETPTIPGNWTIVVALVSIAAKEFLFRITVTIGTRTRNDVLLANAWHHRSDALSSLAVLAGLIGAKSGLPILDPVAAGMVALAVGHAAWGIARNALDKLTDKALTPEEIAPLHKQARAVEGIIDIHEIRGRWMGNKILLDLHALVPPGITVSEGHRLGEILRHTLMTTTPILAEVIVHIESEEHDHNFDPGPSRQEIHEKVQILLNQEEDLLDWEIFSLHYLGGEAQVEICLFLPDQYATAQAKAMTDRLQQGMANLAKIKPGRIYFSSAPEKA